MFVCVFVIIVKFSWDYQLIFSSAKLDYLLLYVLLLRFPLLRTLQLISKYWYTFHIWLPSNSWFFCSTILTSWTPFLYPRACHLSRHLIDPELAPQVSPLTPIPPHKIITPMIITHHPKKLKVKDLWDLFYGHRKNLFLPLRLRLTSWTLLPQVPLCHLQNFDIAGSSVTGESQPLHWSILELPICQHSQLSSTTNQNKLFVPLCSLQLKKYPSLVCPNSVTKAILSGFPVLLVSQPADLRSSQPPEPLGRFQTPATQTKNLHDFLLLPHHLPVSLLWFLWLQWHPAVFLGVPSTTPLTPHTNWFSWLTFQALTGNLPKPHNIKHD